MKHKQFTLSNHIECLHISRKKSPITFINVTCKVGSKNEDKTNLGISHFLEHMFFKGTKTYPNNKDIAYAHYLLAMCYYNNIRKLVGYNGEIL